MEFLSFFENSSLAIWLRESPSVLAYPTLLAFHTFGMAFVVGTSSAIALRLLGIASGIPLAPLRKFYPVMQIAFGVSLVSGALLLMLDAVLFLTMPAFYIKLTGIVAALTILRVLYAGVLSDKANVGTGPVPRQAQILAGALLTSWMGTVTAGRGTAYAPDIGWQSAAAVLILLCVLLTGRYFVLHRSAAKTASA